MQVAKGSLSAGPQFLPALTGLRGVAALWVVALHVWDTAFGLSRTPRGLRQGYLGVDVFFILSGFILCHVYQKAFARYTSREHMHFLLVRLARIYPLHIFVLAVLALTVTTLPDFTKRFPPSSFTMGGFVTAALLLQNWTRNAMVWNAPAWSLSAEWAAYIAFPFLLFQTRSIRRSSTAAGLALVLLLALGLLCVATGRAMAAGYKLGAIRLAFEFTAGCLLYRAYQLGLTALIPWAAVNLVAACALAVLLGFPRLAPLSVVVFGWAIFSSVHHPGLLSRALTARSAIFLGEISYSVYLTHFAVIELAAWCAGRLPREYAAAGRWLFWVVLLISLCTVPLFTWRWIERPARRVGRHLADRMAKPRAAAVPVV